MSNPFEEFLNAVSQQQEEDNAQGQMHATVLRAEFEEMYEALTPRQLFLVTSLLSMAALNPPSGFLAIGEIRGWIQHHHRADPFTGFPIGHEIFGGEK